ncbi:nucleolar protein 8 isoform X2 [Lingula anatina]|uniref:Nucleolar protein 8 isoform X2 n=1 Tax=Lingula anatina TaxID=7574 RepID=A0A1S3HER0_LINAN|nr:nucleolar protein 8 isoform X2 [Lingula anatina]|eukprot:XP_013383519.1 nucleolar protein 8 isoform X2 [Lingula anatina]
MAEKKRLYVGGLFEEVTEDDLRTKFARFGNINGIDIRLQKDLTGVNAGSKTFAYLDISITDADLKKCINMYNKTKWKGREVKIQLAKESFLDRLKRERESLKIEPEEVKPKKSKSASVVLHDPFKDQPNLDRDTLTVKGAIPGTELTGEKDWVVGKYGRVLPVVNIRQKDKKKLLRVDPSKQCHQLTKVKDDHRFDQCPVQSLTWEMDQDDSAITKKRKGEFEKWTHLKSPQKNNNTKSNMDLKVTPIQNGTVSSKLKENSMNSDFEIVSESHMSAVKPSQDRVNLTKSFKKKKKGNSNTESSNIQNQGDESGSESASSADTDELLTSNKSKSKSSKSPLTQSLPKLKNNAESIKKQNNEKSNVRPCEMQLDQSSKISSRTSVKHGPITKQKQLTQSVTGTVNSESDDNNSSDEESSSNSDSPANINTLTRWRSHLEPRNDCNDSKETDSEKEKSSEGVKPQEKIQRNDNNIDGDSSADSDNVKSTKKTVLQPKQHLANDPVKEPQAPRGVSPPSSSDEESDIEELIRQEREKERLRQGTNKPGTDNADDGDDFEVVPVGLSSSSAISRGQVAMIKNKTKHGEAEDSNLAKFSDGESSDSSSSDSDDKVSEKTVAKAVVKKTSSGLGMKSGQKERKLSNLNTEVSTAASQSRTSVRSPIKSGQGHTSMSVTKPKSPVGEEGKKKNIPVGGSASRMTEEKHQSDNEKRLQALKQRQKETRDQKRAIQQALAALDSGSTLNKRIVFDSDSEEEQQPIQSVPSSSTKTQKEEITVLKSLKSQTKKAPKTSVLFDSDDSDAEENEEADMFRLRPQFEGKAGQKLMKLQGRFGSDSRFRLDERFQESDSGEEGDTQDIHQDSEMAEDENSLQKEKKKALEILKTVVGESERVKRRSAFTDISGVRYDPTREEHKQFELKIESTVPAKKEKKKKQTENKVDDEKTDIDPVPEVSKEKFYEVSTSFKDIFGGASDQGFSFLGNSKQSPEKGTSSSNEEMNDKELKTKPSPLPSTLPWQQENFCFTNSDDGEDNEDDEEKASKHSNISERHAETMPVQSTAVKTFFFKEDDNRLKEGIAFFHRQEGLEEIRKKWNERKPDLVEEYRMKRKKALRRNKLQASSKKKRMPQYFTKAKR